jgi:predicted permease
VVRGIAQDLKLALRLFSTSPVFAAIVVLTLALGTGANTAIFTLLDQVMLRSLPVERPDRLVVLHAPGPDSGWRMSQSDTAKPLSQPMLDGLRGLTPAFAGAFGRYRTPLYLTAGTETERVEGDMVTGTFFEVLGLRAAHGRLFTADDDRTPSGHPVVVLGHSFFERRFGGDPSVVGRVVSVNSHPMTVVGIAPRGFNGVEVGSATDVYVPVAMQREAQPTWGSRLGDWRSRFLVCMARLRDGVSLDEARAQANVVYARLLAEDLAHIESAPASLKESFLKKSLVLLPGARGVSGLRDASGKPLLVLMAMVGLVLLIACANVASLLLTRASARRKETALRQALGASRMRLVRLHLVESLTLAAAGGLLGLQFAYWLGELLIRALPSEQSARTLSAAPDWRVGLFTLVVSTLAGVGFGLAPALRAGRPDVAQTLRSDASAVLGGGSGPHRLRRGLVVSQIALSLLLLIGAGLFARSLGNLRAVDPGFEPDRLFAFDVDPARAGHDFPSRVAMLRRIQDELRSLPGIVAASGADVALMTDSSFGNTLRILGYEPKEGESTNAAFNSVAPGFFETLGIPLVAGRDLAESDVDGAPKVAVVNEVFARRFFKAESPLGRRFGMGRRSTSFDYEIVGVVRDGKSASMREEPKPFVYVPFMQDDSVGGLTFYVRSSVKPESFGAELRAAVARVDPALPVTGLKTMRAQIGESLFVERMVAALSAAFGFLATLLAAIGLYGVTSYAVAERTSEIGLRVALGAGRPTVLAMVLKDVAVLAALGIAIGLPGGFGLGRLIESQLFGMSARDPFTFATATLALVATVLVAGLIPAIRAARLDPMKALRYE